MASDITRFVDKDGVTHAVDYQSLANKPKIPSKVSDLTNDSGFMSFNSIDNDTIKINSDGKLYVAIGSASKVAF